MFEYFRKTYPSEEFVVKVSESRPDEGEGEYVQTQVAKDMEVVKQVVQQGGIVFCCGNGRTMVRELEPLLTEHLKDVATLKEMTENGQYRKEVWI